MHVSLTMWSSLSRILLRHFSFSSSLSLSPKPPLLHTEGDHRRRTSRSSERQSISPEKIDFPKIHQNHRVFVFTGRTTPFTQTVFLGGFQVAAEPASHIKWSEWLHAVMGRRCPRAINAVEVCQWYFSEIMWKM